MDSDETPPRTHDATLSSASELCALSHDGLYIATADLNDNTIAVRRQWAPKRDNGKPGSRTLSSPSGGAATAEHALPSELWRMRLSDGHLTNGRTRRKWDPAIQDIAFSPSIKGQREHILAIATGTKVLLHDAVTGRRVAALKGNGRIILALQWSTHATQSAEIYDYWSNDDSPDVLVLTMGTIDGAKLTYVQQSEHDLGEGVFVRSYSWDLELAGLASSAVHTGHLNGYPSILRRRKGLKAPGMRAMSIAKGEGLGSGKVVPSQRRKDEPSESTAGEEESDQPHPASQEPPKRRLEYGSPAASPATVVADDKMVSSLELPKAVTDTDDGSPMPFLSPAIPSRRLPPVDEQIDLVSDESEVEDRKLFGEVGGPHSPHILRSREASFASTREPDSDSDDETFVPGTMHGSASFLPGGVNVPLPKGCGAVFADNGTLVTFFERRAAVRVADTALVSSKMTAHRDRRKKMAKLFPSFERMQDSDDDVDSITSDRFSDTDFDDVEESADEQDESLALRDITTRPSDVDENAKFFSAVHDLADLAGSPRSLALSYHFYLDNSTTLSTICENNARVAEGAGHHQHSTIWRFLLILVDGDPASDIIDMAKPWCVPSMPSQRASSSKSGYNGGVGPAASWIVRQCFEWAENRADIQLLALMSAVLVQTPAPQEPAVLSKSFDRPPTGSQLLYRIDHARPLTPLEGMRSYMSPKKKKPKSGASSRQSSKPTTPYLDSGANTPPLPATLSRQSSSKMSTSPELHRSSFSAAARQYAQSITDRFAAYGSSPPSKKISPASAEDLAESLKSKVGSWSKSVSFAKTESTVDTAREDARKDGDGYDSDRTIEDVSMPQTPRSGVAMPVAVKMLNEDVFGESGSDKIDSEAALLPSDLAQKAFIWRRYYAEQLRCWDMLIEAAEIENVVALTVHNKSGAEPLGHTEVIPMKTGKGSSACNICYRSMRGLQQFCASCGHAAHLACVQQWLQSCAEAGEDYVCPSGCGCKCSIASYDD